ALFVVAPAARGPIAQARTRLRSVGDELHDIVQPDDVVRLGRILEGPVAELAVTIPAPAAHRLRGEERTAVMRTECERGRARDAGDRDRCAHALLRLSIAE